MILVDSNVLIDLMRDDPPGADWSANQLRLASLRDQLAINAVIYAEIAALYETPQELDNFLAPTRISFQTITAKTAFAAAKAYQRYRKASGVKTGVLADFFIGAQAQTEGWTLLTRDKARYQTYFPTVKLISP